MKEGWEIKRLEELTERINGLWKGKKGPYMDVLVYSMVNFTKDSDLDYNSKPRPIVARESQYEKRKLKYGDILIEKSGGGPNQPVGRAVLFDIRNQENNSFSNFTTRLRIYESLRNKLTPQYLHKFLKMTYLKGITKKFQKNSTNIRNLQLKEYLKIEIPIPPLSEQRQIVAILDEAFAAIDQAKANVERNIENAEELFQSKLNAVFSQRGEGWEEKVLGDLTYVKSGGTPRRSKQEYWEEGTIPWYSSGELNELFTIEPERFITAKGLKESNAKLFPKGSLLVGMYDTAALKMSVLDRDAAFNQAVSGAKPIDGLNLQFVMHAINAKKSMLLKQRRGVRQKNLNLTKIKAIRIPFPKIEIQNEVVAQLRDLRSCIDEVLINYRDKLQNLEDLKKSLLQKAFAGELTEHERQTV